MERDGSAITGSARVTGIPVETLFELIGALLLIIYADIKRELRSIRRSAETRDKVVERLRIALCFMARTLKVPFAESILMGLKGSASPDDTSENHTL